MSTSIPPPESPTEARNPRSEGLDRLDSLQLLEVINDEDRTVADAVARCLPALAELVDLTAQRLRAGGRVHYFGAGTSGRLAMLDAVELEPTFSLEPGRFVAHTAGGHAALTRSVEGAEDASEVGAADAAEVDAGDVAVGLAASGATPYVRGALWEARRIGAVTAVVTSNPSSPIAEDGHRHLYLPTGPEVVAGSTRMKAGTAQKLVLNAFSTTVMVRLGKTYSNLMVDLSATNEKLRGRTLTILREATGLDEDRCLQALHVAEGDLKTALVTLLAGTSVQQAATALSESGGEVRAALAHIEARSQ